AAEVAPELVLEHGEADHATVGGDEDPVGRLRASLWRHFHPRPPGGDVEHRQVEPAALAARVALAQGGDYRQRRRRPRAEVDIRDADPSRLVGARAGGDPEVVDVMSGQVAVGAVGAVAGKRAIDDVRAQLAHLLVTEAEPG